MATTMGILGKKIGMTRIYTEMGEVVPVTVIEAGPCIVLQVKKIDTDGYDAIQVGFSAKKSSHINKAEAGHFKKSDNTGFKFLREFRVNNIDDYELGMKITLDGLFTVGDSISIQGVSKGKGFQGVVKRYNFKGGRATHGSKFHRAPGSIGCSAWPARVVKGKKMPGRMGNENVLNKNLTVMDVRSDENLLLVKGSVPGAKQSLLKIYK